MKRPVWPGLLRDAFETSALDTGAVKDARRLHRRGLVHSVSVSAGRIVGLVHDDEQSHLAHWEAEVLADADWEVIEHRIHRDPPTLAALLDEEPSRSGADLGPLVAELVPDASEIDPGCDCEDWMEPCRHALAVGLAAAEHTRSDLWALFRWRGRGHDWLVTVEASARAERLLTRHGRTTGKGTTDIS